MFTKRIHLAWGSFEQPADICHKIKISTAFWFAVDEDVDYGNLEFGVGPQ